MTPRLTIILIGTTLLAGCIDAGYQPSYIISQEKPAEVEQPKEEPKEELR